MGSVGKQGRGTQNLCCPPQGVLYPAAGSKQLGNLGLETTHGK